MKLSTYANKIGLSYRRAWQHFADGQIPGAYQLPTGTVIVPDSAIPEAPSNNSSQTSKTVRAAIYARVSSRENNDNLDLQADRLSSFCAAKGYNVTHLVKEVGSGLNDNRKKLLKLLASDEYDVIVVEHKDRLTRFGFNYISTLLIELGKRVEVINVADGDKEDLVQDFTSVITSFCARIYGLRRSKRKTEKLIEQLRQ